jgi:acylphosphatase
MRTLLIVSGNVQGVGYRTLVKQIANRMKVPGTVRNLPDGNVEIYCQCSDKKMLDRFIKQIERKAQTDDVFAVNVDSIEVYDEDHPKFGEPKTNFKTFEIDYERGLDQFQKESLERSEIGILLLGGTISGIGDVRTEVGGTRADIKEMHTELKGEIHSGFSDLSNKQDTMNEKLGNMGGKLDNITEATIKTHEKLNNIDGRLGDALERYDVFGQKMISIETEMKEFTKQITRLVDHLVESKKEGK